MTYLSLEAELHDLFWEGEGPAAELPLLEDFLTAHPGKALEVGCGSGRLLFPLFEKGYDISGIDLSPDMLAMAREKAEGKNINLHEGNIDTFQLKETFSAIAVPAFTLQLSEDPMLALRNLREHLTPGGGLYITVFLPWSEIVGETEPGEWHDDNGHAYEDGRSAICRTKIEIDRISQTLKRDHHYRLYDKTDALIKEHKSTQNLTWFWKRELELMLKNTKFSVKKVFQDFSHDAPEDDVPHVLTFIATAVVA